MDNRIEEENRIPQPNEITQGEKERGMAAYLMMFASTAAGLPLPFINLLASVAYYYFIKETSRFVKFHSHQSLISQVPITIFNSVVVSWTIYIIFNNEIFTDAYWSFVITAVIGNLIYLIFSVIAAFKAYAGRLYYFIFFGRVSYKLAFERDFDPNRNSAVNRPPQ